METIDEAVEAVEKEKVEKVVIPSGTVVMCDDGVERPVISREEAMEQGLTRYFTGIECRNGHMSERKVKGYVCVACSRNRQKARRKIRMQEDPEFKAKMAEKRRAKHKERYKNDPDYRQKVLDRAKRRRQRVAEEKKLNQAQAEITG